MPRRPARAWGSVDRGKHRRAIELRKHHIPEAELVGWREGNTGRDDMRDPVCSGGVKEPGMCGHSPRENRETSGRSLLGSEAALAEATGKVSSRTPVVQFPRGVGRCSSTEEVGEQGGGRPGGVDGGKDTDQEEASEGGRVSDPEPSKRVDSPTLAALEAKGGDSFTSSPPKTPSLEVGAV